MGFWFSYLNESFHSFYEHITYIVLPFLIIISFDTALHSEEHPRVLSLSLLDSSNASRIRSLGLFEPLKFNMWMSLMENLLGVCVCVYVFVSVSVCMAFHYFNIS